MNWKEIFNKGQELVIATCSNNAVPNINIVISLGFIEDKLLLADCQMNTTLKNLEETKQICIFAKKEGTYLRLKGTTELFDSGKYFELCQKINKDYTVKHAILVNIKEVFDLDKINTIYPIVSSVT